MNITDILQNYKDGNLSLSEAEHNVNEIVDIERQQNVSAILSDEILGNTPQAPVSVLNGNCITFMGDEYYKYDYHKDMMSREYQRGIRYATRKQKQDE